MSAAPATDMNATYTGIRAATEEVLPRRVWQKRYARRLLFTDFLVLAIVIGSVQVFWLGFDDAASFGFPTMTGGQYGGEVSYGIVSGAILILWMLVLVAVGSVDSRVMGVGHTEYRKITDSGIGVFAALATSMFLLKLDVARGYLLLTFAIGIAGLLFARMAWRKWLKSHRARGDYSNQVVLVGSRSSIRHISDELAKQPWAGYNVVGAALAQDPRDSGILAIGDVPVISDFDGVREAMDIIGADTVIITGADHLDPQRVRELSWELEKGEYSLVMAPSLTDVSGPRIHSRPVAGLPLMHVETPRYTGLRAAMKRSFDILASLLIILLLFLPMGVVATMVKVTSPGPVLFKQRRIGLDGEEFRMLKFRSMRSDAEQLLAQLDAADRMDPDSVLFKMKDDPRVTKVGRFIRRYSIDELPQVFNVLMGSMSLVGPRPSLAQEVAQYEHHVHRRFLVKPGITGLWQVSGRSDLPWEEAVRLDLYYVENWSLTADLAILWRTGRAIFEGKGAY
ncbi:sugar transferase [Nesterenkonia aurantiaca]|uniref:Undecaprenyl-phosphate galactose phosphotransferase WbaP/exopolysaccharide biosynthesis polyprenyl glycosylphosphotransferase n=1 Tax=Nesterenkonia aurantiaca TaxID=1436010 RepID=A0A4R7FVI1_9MICC|nr:sugar transferase [Nesterenkonia aurantiaca]TDS82636.1 Undecaprenyl-phosphate galactose phosphotransferase WbaP/exopolysaccharide biosynthesis polyprenyl glycosylphosphotransferase [Nesterenkonia aurantiaca]